MKKRFGSVIAVVMVSVLALTGCGSGGTREQTTKDDGTVVGGIESGSATADLTFLKSDNMCLLAGTYFIGQDMKAGNYTIKCVDADYGMRVTVFGSESDYQSYFSSRRFTVGENNEAIEKYAKNDEYIYKDNDLAVVLSDGDVLEIDGSCIATLGGGSSVEPVNTLTIGRGMYEPGDIEPGTYCVTTIESGYSLQFVVFKDKSAYDAFVAAKPVTNGQYSDEIGNHGLYSLEVLKDQHGFLTIKDGNYLGVIGEGKAEITKVEMGWK